MAAGQLRPRRRSSKHSDTSSATLDGSGTGVLMALHWLASHRDAALPGPMHPSASVPPRFSAEDMAAKATMATC